MRRCVFVGPSLHGAADRPSGIEFRPPAGQGDLIRAVRDGFECIGLIDGYFGSRASTWHKEILFALAEGCTVMGAASMGALRAAECHRFGMLPVGRIAWQYVNGELDDDSEVALIHGPQEIDFAPFTEPLVDVRATIEAMISAGLMKREDADVLMNLARSIHFSDRTLDALVAAGTRSGLPAGQFLHRYEKHRVRAKQEDACELLQRLISAPAEIAVAAWELARSASLEALLAPHGC